MVCFSLRSSYMEFCNGKYSTILMKPRNRTRCLSIPSSEVMSSPLIWSSEVVYSNIKTPPWWLDLVKWLPRTSEDEGFSWKKKKNLMSPHLSRQTTHCPPPPCPAFTPCSTRGAGGTITCAEAGSELSASAGRREGLRGCLCCRRSQLFVTREAPPHPACHGQARQTDRLLPNWHLPL